MAWSLACEDGTCGNARHFRSRPGIRREASRLHAEIVLPWRVVPSGGALLAEQFTLMSLNFRPFAPSAV